MSLIGKVLAFFNIFAIVGALVLMGMNLAQRQKWEYGAFREDLMISGLPLDDKETDALQQTVVSKIGPDTQRDLFNQVSPVATQQAEVSRVKGELDGQIQGAGDKKKQMAVLARILTPMADTIEQRTRMIAYQTYLSDDQTFRVLHDRLFAAHKAASAAQPAGENKSYERRFRDALALVFSDPPGPFGEALVEVMKADPKADFDKALDQSLDNQLTQLQGQYKQLFDNASSTSDAPAQRRRAIARLLFNMVEVLVPKGEAANLDLANNPAYKRYFMVVGVQSALEAINQQATILQGLVFETGSERLRERYLFAEQHHKLVDLVMEKKTELDNYNLALASKKKEAATHLENVDRLRQDVKGYEEQLAAERRTTARRLEQLRQVSDQLFVERVKLRENSEDNQKLEKQIRTLEQGR